MIMNINDCIRFTNENPICYLATAENDQPRVRVLGFWFADETKMEDNLKPKDIIKF
jgi:pyridoxamine 5'-phosphate oxidase